MLKVLGNYIRNYVTVKNLNQKNKIRFKTKATKKDQTKLNQRKKISYFSSWIDEYVQLSSNPFLLRQMYLVP